MRLSGFRIVPFILVVATAVWSADAAIDAFVFGHGSFRAMLYGDLSGHELYFRLFIIAAYSSVILVLARLLAKSRSSQQELSKHIAAVEASMDGIAIFDHEGKYIHVNCAYAEINGYDGPQDLIGKTFRTVYEERSVAIIEQVISPNLAKSGRWRGELIAKRKNGSTYYQEVSVSRLADGGRVCIVRDVTWRKRSEERSRRAERFLNTIFDSIRDPFCIFDDEYRIVRANAAYAHLKNTTVDKLVGRKCFEALNGREDVCDGCLVQSTLRSGDPCAKEKRVTAGENTDTWVEIYTYPILDDQGAVTHVIEYTRDISERKRSEEEKQRLIQRLEHLSRTDELTGLLNRRALTDSLAYELERASRYQADLALLLCDIDEFKVINDTYGHDAGDHALQTISAILRTQLRNTDIAGRYGGDEFMLILPETSLAGAESLAGKLRAAVAAVEMPVREGSVLRLSLSIGVAACVSESADQDALIKRADDNLYATKQSLKGGDKAHP